MIENNIDMDLINKYMNEQCRIINEEYNDKIAKSKDKVNIKITDKKKEIDFLFKNKLSLDTYKANPEYIKYYIEKQYNNIKKNYN